MAYPSTSETFTALAAIRVGVGALLALATFDGNVEAEETGAVQVFNCISCVPFVLKLDKSESYKNANILKLIITFTFYRA